MKTLPLATVATGDNVVQLTVVARAVKPTKALPSRFKIQPYANPRTGSQAWRVTGSKRGGERIRENYAEQQAAQVRQLELENEWLTGRTETTVRATKLTEGQVRLAEQAFARLEIDADMPLAVEHWLKHGKHLKVAESPRLDDAFTKYCEWLPNSGLRDLSQSNQRRRVNVFVNSVANVRVSDVTHDFVNSFLTKREVAALSKDNDRRAISGFFTWCIHRDRRWTTHNPCKEIRIAKAEKAPPAVLTVDQCRTLLRTAEKFKKGKHAPFAAVALFAGLRPFEVARLNWQNVNLADREIRLEGVQTKTGQPRVIAICDTLAKWLQAYEGKPFFVPGWLKDFRVIKEAIGYGVPTDEKPDLKAWTPDILRHTAVSHYFRKTGSYGQTAEQFGNSEKIIKSHYQGRVSSEDTKAFYKITPGGKSKPAKKGKARK
jgi:integrase